MDVEDVLNINDEALKTASVVQCIAMLAQLSTDYQVASNSMECPMRGDPTELQAIKDRQKELDQRFIELQKKITTTKRKRKREEQQAAVAAQPTAAGIGAPHEDGEAQSKRDEVCRQGCQEAQYGDAHHEQHQGGRGSTPVHSGSRIDCRDERDDNCRAG